MREDESAGNKSAYELRELLSLLYARGRLGRSQRRRARLCGRTVGSLWFEQPCWRAKTSLQRLWRNLLLVLAHKARTCFGANRPVIVPVVAKQV